MLHDDVAGMIVTAKAGRDKGRSFVVIAAEGDDFVLMADGKTRKLEKPKKKKLMHLAFGTQRLNLGLMPENKACADAYIRKALCELGYNNKTVSEEG